MCIRDVGENMEGLEMKSLGQPYSLENRNIIDIIIDCFAYGLRMLHQDH